jgi:hypothetical protein
LGELDVFDAKEVSMSDNGMNIFYWWLIIFFTVLLIPGRSRRSMKPRVRLDANEFLRILDKAGGKVIRVLTSNRMRLFPPFVDWIGIKFPSMYVVEGNDYYFYTLSKQPLSLPESAEVVDAQAFSFS